MSRILIFTPTYADLLQPETVASIEAMEFGGEMDWLVSRENPYPGRDMRNVVHQFRRGRQLAMDGGYDALLCIEHDMIVPVDAAERLWDTDAGVVYGCYQLRHRMYAVNLFQYVGKKNMGMSLSLYPRELQYAQQRGWVEVSGAGFGCILIRREVLKAVPFRDAGNAPDLPFAKDCLERGIQQIGRADVICGHIDNDWTDQTLWPFDSRTMGMVARVLALQTVTVMDDGRSISMKKDRYYSLSMYAAREFERCGFVRITNEADVVAEEMAREVAVSPRAEAREKAVKPSVRKRKPRRVSGDSDEKPSKPA